MVVEIFRAIACKSGTMYDGDLIPRGSSQRCFKNCLLFVVVIICNISNINLYIKKQHVFLPRNDDLYSIYTFQIKSSLV